MIEQIVFYLFAGMLVLSASMVVVMRNPIHAALFLVLSFFSSAAIWLLLHAEFLAIALVLVYVGDSHGAVPVCRDDARCKYCHYP